MWKAAMMAVTSGATMAGYWAARLAVRSGATKTASWADLTAAQSDGPTAAMRGLLRAARSTAKKVGHPDREEGCAMADPTAGWRAEAWAALMAGQRAQRMVDGKAVLKVVQWEMMTVGLRVLRRAD